MLATGRAINTATCAAAAAAALGQAEGCGADNGASAGEALLLPSARPVSNPVAIPCTSRLAWFVACLLESLSLAAVLGTVSRTYGRSVAIPRPCDLMC